MAKDSKDNLNPQLAAFGTELEAIQKEAGEAQTKLDGHHAHVREALVKTYDLGLKLIEENLLVDFLTAHVKPLTKRYQKNAFHDIVTLGFEAAREDSRSKYRKVLKYAQDEHWDVAGFRTQLLDHGLDGLYLLALKGAVFDPEDEFDETAEEHYHRAKALLNQSNLGSVTALSVDMATVHQVDGFATAILKVSNGAAQVVGFLPEEPKDTVTKRIASIAPVQSLRTRTKLTAKTLYEFFVICDVFNRCVPPLDELMERLAQAKAPPQMALPTGVSAAEVGENLRTKLAVAKKAKPNPVVLGDVQAAKNVLWLSKNAEAKVLTASIGTHLPAMVMMEMELPLDKFPIAVDQLEIAHTDARKFYVEFRNAFDFRARHAASGTSVDVNSTPPQQFHYVPPASETTAYRSLKTGAVAIASFCLTKGMMAKLASWRAEFGASTSKGAIKSFPKVLEFGLNETRLSLQFPNKPNEINAIAEVSVEEPYFSTPGMHWYLETRYLERMIQLAKDYGVDFEVSLLAMVGAPFAVEFACKLPTGRCKLTLPLSTGPLTGLIEITQAVPAVAQGVAAQAQPAFAATPSSPAKP